MAHAPFSTAKSSKERSNRKDKKMIWNENTRNNNQHTVRHTTKGYCQYSTAYTSYVELRYERAGCQFNDSFGGRIFFFFFIFFVASSSPFPQLTADIILLGKFFNQRICWNSTGEKARASVCVSRTVSVLLSRSSPGFTKRVNGTACLTELDIWSNSVIGPWIHFVELLEKFVSRKWQKAHPKSKCYKISAEFYRHLRFVHWLSVDLRRRRREGKRAKIDQK